ncbi:MAG TPA: hypothetical protein DCM28_23435 [Phycisphaerales bacterium]|nr:hypothetical protein [Phycisphaerales bacterium]|tara:strand:- start:1391 stop:1807 length:417 start_codon:yes stop_codon:yes gene_type:complete
MNWQLITTSLATFLIGVVTGACGSYFASKYTDKRRHAEAKKTLAQKLKKVYQLMPELIEEIKDDLTKEDFKTVREIVILNRPNGYWDDGLTFAYYKTRHHDLKGKFSVLQNSGFVIPVSDDKYKITEEFVELITNFKC